MSNEITNSKQNFDLVIYENGEVSLPLNTDKETIFATQDQMATLFHCSVDNVSLHLKNIFKSGELDENSVYEEFSVTARDGKNYDTKHYNLDAIIAIGYRVNSIKATQFRRWATGVLKNYLISGYALDEETLQNNPEKFEILLQKIREIRTSEKMFYEKVKDIFTITSVDYEKGSEQAKTFFSWVQNKFHYAITGETAAEIIVNRLSSQKKNAGLTSFKKENPTVDEAKIAKNYLSDQELKGLINLSEQFLLYAEAKALKKEKMYMEKWLTKVNQIIEMNEMQVLYHKGKISKEYKDKYVQNEIKKYREVQKQLEDKTNPKSRDKS